MTEKEEPAHFKGKNVAEHLKEARRRGALATSEIHGTELPGHLSAALDSAKDTTLAYLILWAIAAAMLPNAFLIWLLLFGFGWTLWKGGRSALLGWARLERLHRVIEEERWEIEHHREQEKQELREMYAAKGFTGKLLDEVVDVLMADDNRLLRVMLEEELGLTLEVYEHPLKQAVSAGIAALASAALLTGAYALSPSYGIPAVAGVLLAVGSIREATFEKRRYLDSLIWSFSLAFLVTVGSYFFARMLL
jgi:vacuolar iron transporter family protein